MTEPQRCSHGIAWADECPECDLVWAKQIVEHWGQSVDDARRQIEEAERDDERTNQAV